MGFGNAMFQLKINTQTAVTMRSQKIQVSATPLRLTEHIGCP